MRKILIIGYVGLLVVGCLSVVGCNEQTTIKKSELRYWKSGEVDFGGITFTIPSGAEGEKIDPPLVGADAHIADPSMGEPNKQINIGRSMESTGSEKVTIYYYSSVPSIEETMISEGVVSGYKCTLWQEPESEGSTKMTNTYLIEDTPAGTIKVTPWFSKSNSLAAQIAKSIRIPKGTLTGNFPTVPQ